MATITSKTLVFKYTGACPMARPACQMARQTLADTMVRFNVLVSTGKFTHKLIVIDTIRRPCLLFVAKVSR